MSMNCAELEHGIAVQTDELKKLGARWGVVAAIHIGETRLQPMRLVPEVKAIAGAGIEGDRYCSERGTFSKKSPTNQLTLIEAEALEAAERDYGLQVSAAESRRNILTCGIALNHLVGREFSIGEVRLRGLKLCEPCSHLKKLTAKEVIKALKHRGGLRAEILHGGTIKTGDVIREES
ncbi:MAG TPA: MOSC domain-containing protein [Candidatus Limnocylindrales bacterium]|nr:MOSC domain-containing protein [Candidatus Limnocylindrales bacterium]